MRKIRRKCKCGCGEITNYGRKYIRGHHRRSKKHSAETKQNMSKAQQGREHSAETKAKISKARQGREHTDGTKLKISLANMKDDPNSPYCEVWRDPEYKNDIRKDYCENVDCKKDYKRLCNHHIYLDKKRCAPIDIMTLCVSCHVILHRALEEKRHKPANPKDFIIINRPDHVSYIHKKSHEIVRINKIKI